MYTGLNSEPPLINQQQSKEMRTQNGKSCPVMCKGITCWRPCDRQQSCMLLCHNAAPPGNVQECSRTPESQTYPNRLVRFHTPVTKLSRLSSATRCRASAMKLRVAFHSVGMVFSSSTAAIVNPYLMLLSCIGIAWHQGMLQVILFLALLQQKCLQYGCTSMHADMCVQHAIDDGGKLAGPAIVCCRTSTHVTVYSHISPACKGTDRNPGHSSNAHPAPCARSNQSAAAMDDGGRSR